MGWTTTPIDRQAGSTELDCGPSVSGRTSIPGRHRAVPRDTRGWGAAPESGAFRWGVECQVHVAGEAGWPPRAYRSPSASEPKLANRRSVHAAAVDERTAASSFGGGSGEPRRGCRDRSGCGRRAASTGPVFIRYLAAVAEREAGRQGDGDEHDAEVDDHPSVCPTDRPLHSGTPRRRAIRVDTTSWRSADVRANAPRPKASSTARPRIPAATQPTTTSVTAHARPPEPATEQARRSPSATA